MKDPIQEQIEELRENILAIDESDALGERDRFGEAFAVNTLMNRFGADTSKIEALFALLGAEFSAEDITRVPFERYVGCFWRQGDGWSWYPETHDGQVIEAPDSLVGALRDRVR